MPAHQHPWVGDDLTSLTIAEAAELVGSRAVSPIELTEAYLAAIELTEPELNAYVTVTAESARHDAVRLTAELAEGIHRGPLHGIPIGVKDLYDVAGVATTAGSAILRDNVPTADSTVVARLHAAGAVVLGKHATHEFAWGGTTTNEHFGPTRNPHDRERIPGGSSGGSAASVVAGSSAASVGTDTCGSVRIPAALSGCVGLKPTYGRVSLHRVVPLAPSLDHGGPLGRTVRDVATIYSVIAGYDAADARTLTAPVGDVLSGLDGDVRGRRVGRLRGWFERVLDPDVRSGLDRAADVLRSLGCEVRDVMPLADDPPTDDIFMHLAGEALPWHWAMFGADNPGYGRELRTLMSRSMPSMEDLALAREAIARHVQSIVTALRQCDVLMCATVPAPAPRIGERRVAVDGVEMHVEWLLTRLTAVFDAARVPALTLPCGTSRDGLPIGLQLVGRHLDEATLVRVGHAFETAEA